MEEIKTGRVPGFLLSLEAGVRLEKTSTSSSPGQSKMGVNDRRSGERSSGTKTWSLTRMTHSGGKSTTRKDGCHKGTGK